MITRVRVCVSMTLLTTMIILNKNKTKHVLPYKIHVSICYCVISVEFRDAVTTTEVLRRQRC